MLLNSNISGLEDEIAFQQQFLDRLDKISKIVKECPEHLAVIKKNIFFLIKLILKTKTLRKELYQFSDEFSFENLRIPIATSFCCKALSVRVI